MSAGRPDVVVVGGGIVGTAAAAFLAGAGARVTLVERDGLASGASGANSGVIQHPFDPVLAALYRETVGHYRVLSSDEAGFRLPDTPAGMLFVSADEPAVRRQAALLSDPFPELRCEVVTGPALSELEPSLAPGLWACHVPIGYPVAPGASTYAYATVAERRGARLRVGRAAALDARGDRVTGVTVDGERLAADAVLVAAGPWSPGIVDPDGRWRPIRARWGVVAETLPSTPPRHVLEEAEIGDAIGVPHLGPDAFDRGEPGDDSVDFSLVPLEGVAAVGSTFLSREPDPTAWLERILVNAASFVPDIADAPIRGVRACARPLSLDGRPLVGRAPDRRGLFICSGHGPWGLSTGPASARAVADLILGREVTIPPELDPARFGALTAA